MSVLKVKGNLYVSIWSPKVGSVDIGPGYPVSRASFADAVRRARYLWDEIHKADSDLLTPQCHSDLMRGGFSILIDGTDERGFDYTAFKWTPDREMPYYAAKGGE
jgi:hypothetical protein